MMNAETGTVSLAFVQFIALAPSRAFFASGLINSNFTKLPLLLSGKELNSRRPVPRPCLIGSECQVRDPGCWSSVETGVG